MAVDCRCIHMQRISPASLHYLPNLISNDLKSELYVRLYQNNSRSAILVNKQSKTSCIRQQFYRISWGKEMFYENEVNLPDIAILNLHIYNTTIM